MKLKFEYAKHTLGYTTNKYPDFDYKTIGGLLWWKRFYLSNYYPHDEKMCVLLQFKHESS